MKLYMQSAEPKLVDTGEGKGKTEIEVQFQVILAGLITKKEFNTLIESNTVEGIEIEPKTN
jgi:hypothetical protein